MEPVEVVAVGHPVDGALVPGLVASLDGLWAHDSRRFDPVVAPDRPAIDDAGYVEAVVPPQVRSLASGQVR